MAIVFNIHFSSSQTLCDKKSVWGISVSLSSSYFLVHAFVLQSLIYILSKEETSLVQYQ